MNDTKKPTGLHLVTNESAVLAVEPSAAGIFEELMTYSQSTSDDLNAAESHLFGQVLRLGRAMLQELVTIRAERQVPPTVKLAEGQEVGYHDHRSYRYVSIFGEVEVNRAYYWSAGVGVAPLDAELSRPRRCYSSRLTQWALRLSVVEPFESSVDWLAEQLGVTVPKRMVEAMSVEAAADVRAFYEQTATVPQAQAGECLVVSTDGKGIPMTKAELAETPSRRKRGEKAQKKKMATVATMYTVTAQDRLAAVTETGQLPDMAAHGKQVFAELADKPALTSYLAKRVAERGAGSVPTAFLADGQPAMWGLKAIICPEAVEILDFHHAREYLWKAAYTFLPEGSDAATAWVKAQEARFLAGQIGRVIGGLRHRLTKGVSAGKTNQETVRKVIQYFDANRSRMRYDQYLQAGFPIGSGAVESACKQLIVTRMEGAGMRWTVTGAQAMLDLRSVFLNGDWNSYWSFHRTQEHQRLYGVAAQAAEEAQKTEKPAA